MSVQTARSGVTRSRRWRPEMAEIADKELEALQDGFDTLSLSHAVDELDKMRGHLNDREHHNPPEIRKDILKLHDRAMDVVNHGGKGRAPARSEERRVGKGWVSTCRHRWGPNHKKKNN